MYLWQRLASPAWWTKHQAKFANRTDVAVIERPDRKRLTIEVSCPTRIEAAALRRQFGGRVIRLGRNWIKQFARAEKSKPLHAGQRLVITNEGTARRSGHHRPSHIVIPAGAAFGTGQHVTTAMSLRLLEKLTQRWKPGWIMADLGTGSGIFALAAKSFGAGTVYAIDNDPIAISTANANARLNRIRNVDFQVADVLRCQFPAQPDVVTANLFSDLLVAVIPKLRAVPWLIFSGIMRDQEGEVVAALKRHSFQLVTIRRRGKWVALLAGS